MDSPHKNTGVCCHFLLQKIFLNQGSNPGLLYCRQILYRLSHLQGLVAKETLRWWEVGMGHSPSPLQSFCRLGDRTAQPAEGTLQVWEQRASYLVREQSRSVCWTGHGAEGFPGGSDGKESACNVGDRGLIPG